MLGTMATAASKRLSTRDSVTPAQPGLNVTVVRLLAVALTISKGSASVPSGSAPPIPVGYRQWPCVTTVVKSGRKVFRLRFYVGGKGLFTRDQDSFPVGTVFIVESSPWGSDDSAERRGGSLFVMEKCVGVCSGEPGVGSGESWIYARYDAHGRSTEDEPGACGVCRLPLTVSAEVM